MTKCKTPGRRKPRRAAPRTSHHLDDDLVELASVIAEFQLDNNAHGWFRPAWRDGWNAVGLAFETWKELYADHHPHTTEHERGIGRYLTILIDRRTRSAEAYHQASDDITALSLRGRRETQLLIAAMRCYQVLVADSSGGGEVYNDVLKKAFEGLEDNPFPIESFVGVILEWRCRDAIGTTAQMQSDANDRLRRAFITAWQRGLYLAAYSLPPSVDYSLKPTIVKG